MFASLFSLSRCATDPGSGTPISGSSITFTYATGDMSVIVSVNHPVVTAAAVLFDVDSSGQRAQATDIESGVTVDWPSSVTFTLPGCAGTPTLENSTTYTTAKIFQYQYPTSCSAPTSEVVGQASLVIHKNGATRTINGSSSEVFHTIFVTSSVYSSDIGGLTQGDSICSAAAASGSQTASLGGTWRAILSTTTVNANSRISFESGASIKNSAGFTLLANANALWGGTLTNPANYDENGNLVTSEVRVWTGTKSDGTVVDYNGADLDHLTCSNWTQTGVGRDGYVGDISKTDSTWLDKGDGWYEDCRNGHQYHLYCINSAN